MDKFLPNPWYSNLTSCSGLTRLGSCRIGTRMKLPECRGLEFGGLGFRSKSRIKG